MKRYGMVVGIEDDKIDQYVQLHSDTWPAVLERNRDCNLQNYSIFLRKLPDGKHYLFSYFEYVGEDFAMDMERMAADPEVQRWWDECKPCHAPLADRAEGEWWAEMTEVFHQD